MITKKTSIFCYLSIHSAIRLILINFYIRKECVGIVKNTFLASVVVECHRWKSMLMVNKVEMKIEANLIYTQKCCHIFIIMSFQPNRAMKTVYIFEVATNIQSSHTETEAIYCLFYFCCSSPTNYRIFFCSSELRIQLIQKSHAIVYYSWLLWRFL